VRWIMYLTLVFVFTLQPPASAQTASDIATTCRTIKNSASNGEGFEYPGIPNTAWRCMNGSVYVCEMGATGRGCMRTGYTTAPHQAIRKWCRENPNVDYVPGALLAGAAISWRCVRGQPVIIETEGVDEQGYVRRFWRKIGP
jgi:hypothetical protein